MNFAVGQIHRTQRVEGAGGELGGFERDFRCIVAQRAFAARQLRLAVVDLRGFDDIIGGALRPEVLGVRLVSVKTVVGSADDGGQQLALAARQR